MWHGRRLYYKFLLETAKILLLIFFVGNLIMCIGLAMAGT